MLSSSNQSQVGIDIFSLRPVLEKSQWNWLWVGFIVLLVARVVYIPATQIALFYDEAYYHFWSMQLDSGYYSKPPMVAWVIALSTYLFGHGQEFSVKLAAPLLYAGSAYLVFLIGKQLYSSKVGRWSALILFTSPLITFNSLFITTDAPLLFFWAMALLFFIRAIQTNTTSMYVLFGLACGMGMLSKYAMIVLLLSLFIFLVLDKAHQHLLFQPGPWLALLVALLVFSPNLIWNWQHDFISLRHTSEIAQSSKVGLQPLKLIEFITAQFLVLGPIACWLFIGQIHSAKTCSSRLLLCVSLPLLVAICAQALWAGANANWAAPFIIGASIMVGHTLANSQRRSMLTAIIINNLSIALLFYFYPQIQQVLGFEAKQTNTPYYRISGWREIMHEAQAKLDIGPDNVVASDSRKLLAYAHYYLSDWQHNNAIQLVSFNPSGKINDQFALAHDIHYQHAEHFLFMSEKPRNFEGCFSTFTPLGSIQYQVYPTLTRQLYFYRVSEMIDYARCQNTFS